MVNFYQKLAISTAAVALIFTPIAAKKSQAAIITYDFTFQDFQQGQVGKGWLSYDDTLLSGSGTEIANPLNNALSVSFSTPIGIFSQLEEPGFPLKPFVEFQDGIFLGLQYERNIFSDEAITIKGSSFEFVSIAGVVGSGEVKYTPKQAVPETGNGVMGFCLVSIIALGWLKKKKIAP